MSQALLIPGEDSASSGSSITSTHPTLDLDPEYGIGTTGARVLDASLKQGFKLANDPGIGTQDFSFEWFGNVTLDGTYEYVFHGAYSAVTIRFQDSAQRISIRFANTDYYTGFDMPGYGTWHHYLITFDRDSLMTLYVDGVANKTWDISSADAYGIVCSTRRIGIDNGTNNGYSGSLSRIRLYVGNALTADEAKTLYNGGQGLTYAELPASIEAKVTHAWNCMEASDGTEPVPLYDAKGTNDGTEVNG